VLYRARPRVITQGAELQRKLLDRAARWVKPGGALVYSVCSLEQQEGEDVVRSFAQSRPEFAINTPAELPEFVPVAPEGWVRILPGLLEAEGGLDGFFMARLVRSR
jgi:16S rRNA (cytosine967-C5)-methyltransferase